MNIILFDDPALRANLLPFTYTRPVADIRVGILTIAEKWGHLTGEVVSFLTQDYLQPKYPQSPCTNTNLYVNGAICPTRALVEQVRQLQAGQALYQDDVLVALNIDSIEVRSVAELLQYNVRQSTLELPPLTVVRYPWDIFSLNGEQIKADYALLTADRASQPIGDPHTIVYAPENVFLEKGAKVKAAILNAENGPIYLGKNAEVQEGAIIRGPFALGEGSVVNVGGKMRGNISVGPFCKVGGEMNASVFFGYSNKGHEGFLGNSVVGEWCNFGADTNTSNLKNNYASVKVWSPAQNQLVDTSLQFCGLLMADHAKCGINTMFNTGTVVGVGANIFGAGFPAKYVPPFTWGGVEESETFQLQKFFEVTMRVYSRRNLPLTAVEREMLTRVFELTKAARTWEQP